MHERRNCRQARSYTILVVIFVVSICTHTYAQNSLDEHASELLKAALWIIGIAFSLIQTLIGYIFISNIKDIKDSVRVVTDRVEHLDCKKLDVEMHKAICDKEQ